MKFSFNISATSPTPTNTNNVIKQAFKINDCLWFLACKCQEELNVFSLADLRFVALKATAAGAQTFLRVLVLHFELLGISVPETLAFSVFSLGYRYLSWITQEMFTGIESMEKSNQSEDLGQLLRS